MSDLKEINLDGIEQWREYEFGGRVYRIDSPVKVYIGTTTHRVVGPDGVVHCVPAPGNQGCVLRWKGAVIA
jgi:hypothetical protein